MKRVVGDGWSAVARFLEVKSRDNLILPDNSSVGPLTRVIPPIDHSSSANR